MTPAELTQLLATGEQRHAEFKGDGSLSDSAFVARVVRAVIGIANRRDGGVVILGVDDSDPMSSSGMSVATATAWTNFDDVADQVARYADPGVDFTTEQVTISMGTFGILRVEEFSTVPVLCKKAFDIPGGSSILRKGALYIRPPMGKIETREVADALEMRHLLDLAAEKRLRSHIETTYRAGGVILPGTEIGPTDEEQFVTELGELA